MNHKRFLVLLIALGLVCVILGALLPGSVQALFALPSLAVLPFGPVAKCLRALSLSGSAGNLAAWALYLAVCLAPLAVLVKHRSRRSCILAPTLSILLLGGMYLLINPGAAAAFPGSAALLTQMEGAPIGGVLWSVILAWVVLALLEKSQEPGAAAVMTRQLLHLLAVWTVAVTCLLQSAGLSLAFGADNGIPPLAMALLKTLVGTATDLLTVPVLLAAADLPKALAAGFDDSAVTAADKLASRAALALRITVTARLGYHLLQLALSGLLTSSAWNLDLPLSQLACTLAALLLARYIREAKRLQDESDLFI